MKMKLLIAGSLLALSGAAWPQMTPQQMQQQLPPSDPSSSQYHSVYLPAHGVGDTIQPSSEERWEDRWGAIAIDAPKGVLGVIRDAANKSVAERGALDECHRSGGMDCRVELAYYNQCAALIVGKIGYGTAHAATKEEATRVGLSDCEAKDSDCRVHYSGCSLPIKIK